MASLLKLSAMCFALVQVSAASAIPDVFQKFPRAVNESRTCNGTYVRKPWEWLTAEEKSAYLQAEVCLMNSPTQLPDVLGAVSRWDDIQHIHLAQSEYIHFVGAFLPWHRYFIAVHQRLLRDECGYNGSMPYWTESYAQSIGIGNSSIWGPDGFGSNGFNSSTGTSSGGANCTTGGFKRQIGGSEPDGCFPDLNSGYAGCLYDGPFANVTLHLQTDQSAPEDYCISRNWDDSQFGSSSQSRVDSCLAYDDFESMWNCLETGPHGSGHAGVGGLMTDVSLSPGDPVFWLHHTWLDSNWWLWQTKNLSYSLTAIAGSNTQSFGGSIGGGFRRRQAGGSASSDSSAFLDYDGDPGNTTTLNHTLWMVGVSENLTIADLMDVREWPSCAEYVLPDEAWETVGTSPT